MNSKIFSSGEHAASEISIEDDILSSRDGWKFPGRGSSIYILVSIIALVPCFWHRHIEAGDLASHTYNAWLAQVIHRGEAPGLSIVPQVHNVLADLALVEVARVLGLMAAEKIVVAISILTFIWGSFRFISIATGRAPWPVFPAILMIAYGWTFEMGFLNYFLSVGLAFWAVSFFLRGKKLDLIFGIALSGLAITAHLMGAAWLAGIAIYLWLARRLGRGRWAVLFVVLLTITGIHFHIAHKFRVSDPVSWRIFYFLGFDQCVLFSRSYRLIALITFLLALFITIRGGLRERKSKQFLREIQLPLELYFITLFATSMLWSGIQIPSYATGFTYVSARLTLFSAILGLCVVGCVEPRKWHLVAFSICMVVFFGMLYSDTARLSGMEDHAESLVSQLPRGSRVIQTIFLPPGSRIGAGHLLDRAVIGRAFSYANYEPASQQFRIRAAPGSPIVTASSESSEQLQHGTYTVRAEDLPLFQIYQCDERDITKLCMRALHAGEVNGRLGYHPKY